MKKSKFTEAQIAFILRQAAEGTPVPEVCRKAGISDATRDTQPITPSRGDTDRRKRPKARRVMISIPYPIITIVCHLACKPLKSWSKYLCEHNFV